MCPTRAHSQRRSRTFITSPGKHPHSLYYIKALYLYIETRPSYSRSNAQQPSSPLSPLEATTCHAAISSVNLVPLLGYPTHCSEPVPHIINKPQTTTLSYPFHVQYITPGNNTIRRIYIRPIATHVTLLD